MVSVIVHVVCWFQKMNQILYRNIELYSGVCPVCPVCSVYIVHIVYNCI